MNGHILVRVLVSSWLVFGATRPALACPVCFGQSDAPMALATNAGVLAMLGVVVAVLACFATFFVHLMRRAKMVEKTEETA